MIQEGKAFSGFSVNNLQKAKEFYGKILGLNVENDEKMPDLLNLHINEKNTILIYPKPNHEPATFTILNFPVKNIAETVDELKSRGVKFIVYNEENFKTDEKGIMWGDGHGPDIAWFNDPAGNILSVIESDE